MAKEAEYVKWVIESITYGKWRPGDWMTFGGGRESEEKRCQQAAVTGVYDEIETLPPKSRWAEIAVFGFLYPSQNRGCPCRVDTAELELICSTSLRHIP